MSRIILLTALTLLAHGYLYAADKLMSADGSYIKSADGYYVYTSTTITWNSTGVMSGIKTRSHVDVTAAGTLDDCGLNGSTLTVAAPATIQRSWFKDGGLKFIEAGATIRHISVRESPVIFDASNNVQNSVFSSPTHDEITLNADVSGNNNVFHSASKKGSGVWIDDGNNLWDTDPGLTTSLRLKPGSPAIDWGVYIPEIHDGTKIYGDGPDAGWVEYFPHGGAVGYIPF